MLHDGVKTQLDEAADNFTWRSKKREQFQFQNIEVDCSQFNNTSMDFESHLTEDNDQLHLLLMALDNI